MRTAVAVMAFFLSSSLALGEEYKVRFTAKGKGLPAFKAIVLVPAGSAGPGPAKHMPEGEAKRYDESVTVTDAGPYDVWWIPKSGLAVPIKSGVKLDPKEETGIVVDDF